MKNKVELFDKTNFLTLHAKTIMLSLLWQCMDVFGADGKNVNFIGFVPDPTVRLGSTNYLACVEVYNKKLNQNQATNTLAS